MNAYEKALEALESIRDITTWGDYCTPKVAAKIFVIAQRAISFPPRNCDVGTPEEQTRRFNSYCINHRNACNVDMECCRCPLEKAKARCDFAWAQMPYEAAKGGAL